MSNGAVGDGEVAGGRTEKGATEAYRFQDSLDRWLRSELDAVYHEVLDQPLPPEMMELVRLYQAKWDELHRVAQHKKNRDKKGRNHGRTPL